VLRQEFAEDEAFRNRLLQEARICARIPSDHVVQVMDADVDVERGVPYLVMELLEGEGLEERIGRKPFDVPELLKLFEQLCDAIGTAHAAGIVHRDLKPENVFLCKGRLRRPFFVKVLDFGIAKLLSGRVGKTLTRIGSPLWMAPEQIRQGGDIAPCVDVWALGLLGFYALTGRVYWRSAQDEDAPLMAVLQEVTESALVAASERALELGVHTALPPGFDAWFLRCVQRDATQRPQNGMEAYAALRSELGVGSMASPLPSSFKSRRHLLVSVVAALLLTALAAIALRQSFRTKGEVPASAVSAPTLAPAPVACTAAAVDAHARAQTALRGALLRRGTAELTKALELDPSCPHVHLALLRLALSDEPGEARKHFEAAFLYRERLDEASATFLDGLQPMVRPKPDVVECERRMRIGATRFPKDPRFLLALGSLAEFLGDYEAAELHFEDASQHDLSAALAVWFKGNARLAKGDLAGARGFFEECLRRSPTSEVCLRQRGFTFAKEGNCVLFEQEAREWTAGVADDRDAYVALASALQARGAPRDSVVEVLERGAAATSESDRAAFRSRYAARLAILEGDFAQAEVHLVAWLKATEAHRKAEPQTEATVWLASFYIETGRRRLAADVCERLLRRLDSLQSGTSVLRTAFEGVFVLKYLLRDGRLTQDEFSRRRQVMAAEGQALLELRGPRVEERLGFLQWLHLYGVPADEESTARLALEILPKGPLPAPGLLHPFDEYLLGKTLALGGRSAEAAEYLQRVTRSCLPFDMALAAGKAWYLLGRTEEERGHLAAARKNYEKAVTLWGRDARSVTAQSARLRLQALH
jgi:tetratricopeptide (TPR) repeat protein